MKRLMMASMIVLGVAGCQTVDYHSEAKVQAAKRWNATRAKMVYAVGLEQFQSGQLDRAASEARKALEMDPDCVQARLLLGKVEIENGRNATACAELRKAIEQQPNLAEAHYLLGVAQEKAEQLDESLDSYRRAYDLDPANLSPVHAAAEVLVRMGKVREAQVYIDSYAPKAENDVTLFELGGRLALMTRDYAKAASYFQRALDLDVENPSYRERLGRAQFLAGMHEAAIDTLEPLARLDGSGPSPWVYATMGDCYLATSNPSSAREMYEIAARGLKSSAGVHAGLAKALLAEGMTQRAIVTAQRALTLDSRCLEAFQVLGYALLQDGQVAPAIDTLSRATRDCPDDGTLWCLLGRARAARGDQAGAVECYTQALRAEPQSKLARELIKTVGATKTSKG